MKKKIYSIIGIAVFAIALAYNINIGLSNGTEINVVLTNIEATAQIELPEVEVSCHQNCNVELAQCWTWNKEELTCERDGTPQNYCACNSN